MKAREAGTRTKKLPPAPALSPSDRAAVQEQVRDFQKELLGLAAAVAAQRQEIREAEAVLRALRMGIRKGRAFMKAPNERTRTDAAIAIRGVFVSFREMRAADEARKVPA